MFFRRSQPLYLHDEKSAGNEIKKSIWECMMPNFVGIRVFQS